MRKWFHQDLFPLACSGAVFSLLAVVFSAALLLPPTSSAEPGATHVSTVRTGTIPTSDGLTLRLTTDLGSINIVPLEAGAAPVVRYTVRLETDARGRAAQRLLDSYSLAAIPTPSGVQITGALPRQSARLGAAQFWVQFEVVVPRGYGVEVSTEIGDITTGDIGGTAALHTQGGNIKAGRIGGYGIQEVSRSRSVANLETEGGHIKVLDVAGDLTAFTGGGYIDAGNIAGDASLHSGGGHIHAGQIGGRVDLETAGGNITVAHADNFVNVRTGGGQIDFGEVRGSVRAQTGGGGIRFMYVSGPMELESSSGSICLTRVGGALQAATSGGTITAWINPDPPSGGGLVHLGGPSQLASGNGDIVIFLPRNLAATIDATAANGGENQIEADPALHLTIDRSGHEAGPLHALAPLNGGGAPLKLRTTGGKIRLRYLDSDVAYRESLVREQVDRLNERLGENGIAPPYPLGGGFEEGASTGAAETSPKTDWLESWLLNFEAKIRGGVSEDPDEFQKRLTSAPKPYYPALAQRAGLQGFVKLQVRVTKDGRLEVLKVVEGEPALADAAAEAVKRWRAKPLWVNGKPLEVISTVTFHFQLH